MGTHRARLSVEGLEARETPASLADVYAQTQANAALIRTLSTDFSWMANPVFRPTVVQFVQNVFRQSANALDVMDGPGTAGPRAVAAANSAAARNIANWLGFPVVPPPPPLTVRVNQAPTQADPTNGSKIVFNAVFSTPVTGFNNSDISFTGSTAGGTLVANVTGTGRKYTVEVTGMTTSGNVVVAIPAGAAENKRGQESRASTSTDRQVTFDNVPPTVTINQASSQFDPAKSSPVTFTVVFNEVVTGFTASDVSFAGSTVGGTLVATVAGTGPTYTVTVTGMTGEGTVVASILAGAVTDRAGNANAASTSTDNTVTFTSVAPTNAGMTSTLPDKDAAEWVAQPSGLKIWDVTVGQGDPVQATDSVRVFYTGWLLNGTVFDSRPSPTASAPVDFALNGLIAGWKEGIPGMRPGGIRRLYVPSALGYGPNGFPPNVPANADLIFEIKLISHT